jgi:hypothetical protein
MSYFTANGFSISDFARLKVGPVVRDDLLEYRREVRLLEDSMSTSGSLA